MPYNRSAYLNRSPYFVCQHCGSRVLKAAYVGHIRKPEIGLSACDKVREASRRQLARETMNNGQAWDGGRRT